MERMFRHSQYFDVHRAIEQFISSVNLGSVLILHDPIACRSLTLFRDVRRVKTNPLDAVGNLVISSKIGFTIPSADTSALSAAEQVGVRIDQQLFESNRNPKTSSVSVDCALDFNGAEQGTEQCFAILREVFSVRDDRWLFITSDPEPDNWPKPLPKPPV